VNFSPYEMLKPLAMLGIKKNKKHDSGTYKQRGFGATDFKNKIKFQENGSRRDPPFFTSICLDATDWSSSEKSCIGNELQTNCQSFYKRPSGNLTI
jgi:hypothetical protein